MGVLREAGGLPGSLGYGAAWGQTCIQSWRAEAGLGTYLEGEADGV